MMSLEVEQIDSLEFYPRGTWSAIPECVAVYFLRIGSEVVYIGATENLKKRMYRHHIKFDSFAFCATDDLTCAYDQEKRLIEIYCPRLNRSGWGVPEPHRRTLGVISDEIWISSKQIYRNTGDLHLCYQSICDRLSRLHRLGLVERQKRGKTIYWRRIK